MRYVEPITTTLQDTYGYSKTIYQPPTILQGVIDESYPVYDPATTYNTGDYVIVDELKTIYRCTADNTAGIYPPTDPTIWVDYGFVNSYRMLSVDEQINSITEGTDIYMEIEFNMKDTLALLNVLFLDLLVQQIDQDGNVVVEKNIDGRDIGCLSFAEYFYAPIKNVSRVVVDDLEYMPASTLRLTFTGDVKIGVLVVGLADDLGVTLYGTSMEFQDKSRIVTDEITGARNVIRYGHVRVIDAQVSLRLTEYDLVAQKVNSIIGKNIVFIPDESDRLSEMTNLAYIERCKLPTDNPVMTKGNATLIGVIE